MTPRVAPWTRRQHPDVIRAIEDAPGEGLVSVHRADIWAEGWVVRIYDRQAATAGTVVLRAEGHGRTPMAALEDALAVSA